MTEHIPTPPDSRVQVMAVLAVPRIEVRNWVQQDWGSVKWGAFLNVMFWCAQTPACQPVQHAADSVMPPLLPCPDCLTC